MARSSKDSIRLGDLIASPMRGRAPRGERLYWRIRTTGEPRQTVWTGWATEHEVAHALAAALQNPTSRQARPEVVRTVGDLLRQWVAVQVQRVQGGEIAARSLVNYKQAARHWLSKVDAVLVERLTRELVEDTLRSWRAAGVAARTVKLDGDVMSAVVKWGAARDLCPALVLSRMASTAVDPEDRVNCEYTPTRDEARAVLAHVRVARDRALIEVLALTGARVGEGAALTVGSWDRVRNELLISGRDLRRGRRGKVRTRRYPVTGRLQELLGELTDGRAAEERLVDGLPVDCSDLVRRALDGACARAGVQRFTAHGLRRLVAQELLDFTDPKTVSELTGHSVAVLLRDYIRPSAERMRDVVQRAHGGRTPLRVVSRAQNAGTTDEE